MGRVVWGLNIIVFVCLFMGIKTWFFTTPSIFALSVFPLMIITLSLLGSTNLRLEVLKKLLVLSFFFLLLLCYPAIFLKDEAPKHGFFSSGLYDVVTVIIGFYMIDLMCRATFNRSVPFFTWVIIVPLLIAFVDWWLFKSTAQRIKDVIVVTAGAVIPLSFLLFLFKRGQIHRQE